MYRVSTLQHPIQTKSLYIQGEMATIPMSNLSITLAGFLSLLASASLSMASPQTRRLQVHGIDQHRRSQTTQDQHGLHPTSHSSSRSRKRLLCIQASWPSPPASLVPATPQRYPAAMHSAPGSASPTCSACSPKYALEAWPSGVSRPGPSMREATADN